MSYNQGKEAMNQSNPKKEYIKTVRTLLPINGDKEKRFLIDFEISLNDFTENEVNNTDTIIAEFGKATEVVADYIKECDSDYLMKQLRMIRLIRIIAIIAIVIITITSTILILQNYFEYKEAEGYYIQREVIQVIDDETTTGG
jgi:hypothetical protein